MESISSKEQNTILTKRSKERELFYIEAFLKDFCSLGMAFELYYALNQAYSHHTTRYARALYYEGRLCDSYAFLEKYRMYESDEEYLTHLEADRSARMQDLIDVFPDFRMRLKLNPRTEKNRVRCRCDLCF